MADWKTPFACTLLLAALGSARAQTAEPGFPDAATAPSAEELKTLLAGKSFSFISSSGTRVRLQFQSTYVYFNVDGSGSGSGPWHTEGGRLCSHLRGRGPSCNEVRLHQGVLHLKRDDGEIVQYLPR